MAMSRRSWATGRGHPPPLAPTVSTFKPRSQWSKVGSSMFLYVNLPGFYSDQIKINSDQQTRRIQIHGERPLSTQTRARFNENYRVPEGCDMSKIKASFLHGLLTIELPIIAVSEERVQDQGEAAQKPHEEERRARGADGEQPSKDARPVETGPEKSGQKAVREEQEGRASEKVVEDKKVAAIGGRGKSEENAEEEKGRVSVADGSLGLKKPVAEDLKPAEMDQQNSELKMKEEESRMPLGDGSLGRKKLEKDGKSVGDVARQEKEDTATKEREVRKSEVDGTLGSKQPKKEEKLVEEKASEGQIQDQAMQKKPGEGVLGKDVAGETRNEIANLETGLEKEEAKDELELRKPDLADPIKKKTFAVESETVQDAISEVIKDRREINGDIKLSYAFDLRNNLLQRMDEAQLQKHGKSLVNVGVAALVIMGFGAYLFLPFLKLFF